MSEILASFELEFLFPDFEGFRIKRRLSFPALQVNKAFHLLSYTQSEFFFHLRA